jgi:hypothetical protein
MNNWHIELKQRAVSVYEVLENWKDIIDNINNLRGKENFNNYKRAVHRLPDHRPGNYVFSDFVDLNLNPWAKWDSMPDSIKSLVILNDIEHIFK